jgi:secreted PhoX family phosphatase
MRFAIGPKGSETSGGIFTPDGNTYFLNIMHPSRSNRKPFNKSMTIAIPGFKN